MTNPTDAYRDEIIQKSPQKETVGHALVSRTECSHTPGPWVAVKNSCYWEVRSELHGMVGDACASNHIHVDGEKLPEDEAARFAEANARLFAAAPDLLAALEAVRFNLRRAGYEETSIMIEGIDAALLAAGLGQKPSSNSRDDSFCDPSLNNSISRGGAS